MQRYIYIYIYICGHIYVFKFMYKKIDTGINIHTYRVGPHHKHRIYTYNAGTHHCVGECRDLDRISISPTREINIYLAIFI